jgi:hypothetical protein
MVGCYSQLPLEFLVGGGAAGWGRDTEAGATVEIGSRQQLTRRG